MPLRAVRGLLGLTTCTATPPGRMPPWVMVTAWEVVVVAGCAAASAPAPAAGAATAAPTARPSVARGMHHRRSMRALLGVFGATRVHSGSSLLRRVTTERYT